MTWLAEAWASGDPAATLAVWAFLAGLVAITAALVYANRRPRRREMYPRCRIDHGLTRNLCLTHNVDWRDDGPCPGWLADRGLTRLPRPHRLADDYTPPADPNEPTLGDKS